MFANPPRVIDYRLTFRTRRARCAELSSRHANVGATSAKKGSVPMTALWSSPERRSEHCPSCAGERPFEQPPCMEGHEACPEWACLECGHALLAGPFEPAQSDSSPLSVAA
ncbi:hypothetical protein GCM10010404_10700 [Nonomuraea africana]